MKKNADTENLSVIYMPIRVVSSGRGVKIAKPLPVMKKSEELVGKGKTKIRELVLKEDLPKKYISFR
jgi:hypothetical protein